MRTHKGTFTLIVAIGLASASAVPPTIHVTWSDPIPPEEGQDYVVSTNPPASEDYPNIELRTGIGLVWRIWSTDPDNPDGHGDIGEISSPHDGTFLVAIRSAAEPCGFCDPCAPSCFGARNVKAIRLVPPTLLDVTALTGARITGDLTDELIVQQGLFGSGVSDVDLVIGGDATANMALPKVSRLTISGEASGTIMVTELGGLFSLGFIEIGDLTDTGSVSIGTVRAAGSGVAVGAPMAGTVTVSELGSGPFIF